MRTFISSTPIFIQIGKISYINRNLNSKRDKLLAVLLKIINHYFFGSKSDGFSYFKRFPDNSFRIVAKGNGSFSQPSFERGGNTDDVFKFIDEVMEQEFGESWKQHFINEKIQQDTVFVPVSRKE